MQPESRQDKLGLERALQLPEDKFLNYMVEEHFKASATVDKEFEEAPVLPEDPTTQEISMDGNMSEKDCTSHDVTDADCPTPWTDENEHLPQLTAEDCILPCKGEEDCAIQGFSEEGWTMKLAEEGYMMEGVTLYCHPEQTGQTIVTNNEPLEVLPSFTNINYEDLDYCESEEIIDQVAPSLPLEEQELVVYWDIDTSGPYLSDTICRVGAYYASPHSKDRKTFTQYAAPWQVPVPSLRRPHHLAVRKTILGYKLLDNKAKEVIASCLSIKDCLLEFLEWLMEVRGQAKGIVLVYHEENEAAYYILMQAILHYNLVGQFEAVVTRFLNGVEFIKCVLGEPAPLPSLDLECLAIHLGGPDSRSKVGKMMEAAHTRAELIRKVLDQVCSYDHAKLDDKLATRFLDNYHCRTWGANELDGFDPEYGPPQEPAKRMTCEDPCTLAHDVYVSLMSQPQPEDLVALGMQGPDDAPNNI